MRLWSNRKPGGLARNLLSVTGIVLLSKALGFVKQIIRANLFGATLETDMLSLSEGVISNVEYVLTHTLITAFVPVYHHAQADGENEGAEFVSASLKFFFLTSFAGACLIMLFARPIAGLLAPSYLPEMKGRLATYIRIFAPGLILILLTACLAALLRANERFVLGEAIHLNQSLSLIAIMLLLWRVFGLSTLIIGFYFYTATNFTLLLASAKPYWRICQGNPFQNSRLKQLLRMTGAPLIGYSMVFVNQMVDKILVSGLETGSLTAMGYASVLSNFVGAIISSFCSVLYTYLSQSVAAKDNQAVQDIVCRNTVLLTTILLPVSVMTILNAKDIVALVFGRGAFRAEAILTTSRALTGYAFMFVPFAIRDLFSRLFYCFQDSRSPTVNSIVGIAFNIAFSVALCPRFGVMGITVATSVSVLVSASLNFVMFRRKHNFLDISPIPRFLPLWAIGACACAFLCGFAAPRLAGFSVLPRLFLTCALAGGGYLLITFPAFLYCAQWKRRN
ncbi:MAG: polysaccharide biosynthesis C-terminal domain-containing protein [Oscillospiraceae bacterium]|nr:polysaccharide biosynthesis C-terminal domain-containing protein [Oscillospiraceae bacterium]